MNIYIIKRNGNPMAATTDESIVEALLANTRDQHWLDVRNNPKYKFSREEYLKQSSWSRQCLPITTALAPASIPLAPPTHNPSPAQPKGTGQILPNQKQVHRIQPTTVKTSLPDLVAMFKKGIYTETELSEKAALLGYSQASVNETIATIVGVPDGNSGNT